MWNTWIGDWVGMWDDDNCTRTYGYVCKTPASPEYDPPPPPPKCDDANHDSFFKFKDACYKWMEEPKSWNDAESTCKGLNAHLVSIMDPMEQAYVFTTIKTDTAWVGLNNRQVYLIA